MVVVEEFGPVDWPTLWVAADWVQAHCIVPDGFRKGEPFVLVDWQLWCLLNFYRLKPGARVGQLAPAFHFRRTQIVGAQKLGKAPSSAAHICVEAVGPALFAGWAAGGELWDCRDHGCGCGWVYEYQSGEAMAKCWPTPLIQITATSQEQTGNIYDALRPMIDDGPLSVLIPHTGEEFIRLPNKGRIDAVTANATSRLGQRVTFCPQDETGFYVKTNGMIKVAETQRRGLAGMGGRAEETTNAWDPTEDSVAQRTAAAAERQGDIFRWHRLPPKGLRYSNREDRRKIHKHVYAGCDWIDLDAIEGEAAELLTVDAPQAERFFGNRGVAGSGAAFDVQAWDAARRNRKVAAGAQVVIGVDGARHDDALAVVACEIESGHLWPLGIWERPADADDDYEHPRDEVDAIVRDAFATWSVWRLYADDQWIEHLLEGWCNEFGVKRVIKWPTYRPRQIAWAIRNLQQAIGAPAGERELSHPGDATLDAHVANARKRELSVKDDREQFMHTLAKEARHSRLKIDGAMAAVLAWEARGDAIAAGVIFTGPEMVVEPDRPPDRYRAGYAPPAEVLVGVGVDSGPMGPLS